MATLGSLVIQMQADLARLQSDMGRAVGIVDRAVGSMRTAAGVAKAALGGLATGLIGGLAGGGLAAGVKSVIDFGDRLNDLSKATGATVEQLSFLNYAAGQSGGSLEGVVRGVGRLQKVLVDVARGGAPDAAKALDALGINARSLAQADLVTQLSTIAEGLGRLQNPAERAAAAQAILGKSYRELLPLLSSGRAEIEKLAGRFVELGGVITQADADQFDALNDSIGDLGVAATAAGKSIANLVAGPLTSLFTAIANAPGATRAALSDMGNAFTLWAAELKVSIAEADVAATEGLGSLLSKIGVDATKRIEKAKQDLATARAALGAVETQIAAGAAPKPGFGMLAGNGAGAALTTGETEAEVKERERLLKAQEQYLDALRRQFVTQNNNTELAKVQADIAFGSAAQFDDQTRRAAIALAEQLDLKKAAIEAEKDALALQEQRLDALEQEAEAEAKVQQQLIQRRQAIVEQLQTPLEKYVETVKELADPRLGLGQETIQRGIRAARDEMEAAQDKANKLKDTARDLGLTFTSAFEDAIVEGKKLSDVLRGLVQDIARLLLRKTVIEPAANALGDLIGNIFGSGESGGGAASLFGNATGGLYRVGGSGAEHPVAFTARAGEFVAVGTRMEGGGGAPVVNIFNQNGSDIQTRRGADGRTLEVVVASALERNVSRGGSRLGLKPPMATR